MERIVKPNKHSDLFNKYYCLIENCTEVELYYNGVAEFLRFQFKKILLEKNQNNNNAFLNEEDKLFLDKISINMI